MGFIQAYKMAIASIIGNKTRAFLTMLGVIIGVAAVISAVAFAQGSTKNITDSIQSLGTNLIQISITGRNSNRNLSYSELMDFAKQNSADIALVAPQLSNSATVKSGSTTYDTSVLGTNTDYGTIRNTSVQNGRFIMESDLSDYKKVAVIGTAVRNKLYPGGDPVGQVIKIRGFAFTIVGLLQEKASGQQQSDDDIVIIPVTVAQRVFKSATIRNFSVQATSADMVNSAMDKLNSFLLGIYKDTKTFRVFNQAQMLTTLNTVTSSMMAVLGGIATISLIVGGIGIMNIMLVSVTERTREIGIRKAIGARKRNILIQFLIEAIVVTGMGGIIGILLGFSIIHFVIGTMNIVPEVYSSTWALIAFTISLGTGVIFGMFPAYKAANLNPIEALRFE